jgi:HD-GYP domain-containing protein (c-di-GMP phosphodiesterase class II)
MIIDREKVKSVFADYVADYDITDTKVRLKVEHTYRVADLCDMIAKSLKLSREDVDLA